MTTSSAAAIEGTESSFDVRWARWQEAGAIRDRALDRRAALIAVLAFCVLAAWLVAAVYQA